MTTNQKISMELSLSILAIVLVAGAALAFKEPTGFGNLAFRSPEAKLKEVYPHAVLWVPPTPGPNDPPALPDPPFTMNRYDLHNQKFGRLSSCEINLHCFDGTFYQVQVACDEPKEKIEAELKRQFGDPTNATEPPFLDWNGPHAHVNYNGRGGRFLIEDREFSIVVQRRIMAYVMSQQAPAAKEEQHP